MLFCFLSVYTKERQRAWPSWVVHEYTKRHSCGSIGRRGSTSRKDVSKLFYSFEFYAIIFLKSKLLTLYDRKQWLQCTGSPESIIDKAEFSNTKQIESYTLNSFEIRHWLCWFLNYRYEFICRFEQCVFLFLLNGSKNFISLKLVKPISVFHFQCS